MKKIYYWSPCLNKVGTYKSTINSAISLSRYSKKNYQIKIINTCGEWNDCEELFRLNNIEVIHLGYNYFKHLPKVGFVGSRVSYLIIILSSIIPLIKLLNKDKPEFLIIHLLTLLPLLLARYFKNSTNFILRISGYPKLNFLRKSIWKFTADYLSKITCPSKDLMLQLYNQKVFLKEKLYFLPDPILNLKEILKKKRESINEYDYKKKYFISVGRLTKQKNFDYLINEFKSFCDNNADYNLLIFGEGELKDELKNKINKYHLTDKVFLMGHTDNVYKFMINAEAFILSSLWEDPGFVLIEAAICNLFIVSSNCKNGPTEFLNSGKGGILFKSNKEEALKNALNEFLTEKNKKNKLILSKKNSKKYTLYRHYNYFKKAISD